jgi:penicillin-binding protein 2A
MAKAKQVAKKKNQWLMLVISFVVFLFLSVIGGYFALIYAGGQMIDSTKLEDIKTEPSVVYDRNGEEIGNLYMKETRDEYVPMEKIPKHLVDAFVAVEDKRFFEHNGVDMIRIAGAIIKDIRAGAAVEGGSTITQQLAKNVFLSHEKTFWRKTKEVSIAIGLERRYSKQQIMEMYLNKIYLGHGLFGVEAASQYYFDKSLLNDNDEELTLAEAAMLAALPKAPTHYSPFNDPEKAKERRDTVLRLMYEQKYITLEQKEAAQKEKLPVRTADKDEPGMNPGYRAYIDYVIREAKEKYGVEEDALYRGGWKIYTSFDRKMQDAAIKAFANPQNFPKNGKTKQVDAGMIVIDAKTGGIAAMMGGRNYVNKGFNLATDMRRQPGSSLKPLVAFAPALDTGDFTIYSRLSNQRQDFNGYSPRNHNGKYSESVSMKEALVQSLNVPTVWLLDQIGIKTGMNYLEKFGIPLAPEDRNLAIALGGLHKGTSPLQMAQAYTAFANGGMMSKAHAITKLEDPRSGFVKVVDIEQTRVIKPQTAWDMHTMLEASVKYGTSKAAAISGREVAGKTGTTQSEVSDRSTDNKDVWFVGYTPEYVSAIWMGFDREDKNNLLRGSSSYPAKLFATVMKEGLKGVKSAGFARPEGVEQPEEPVQELPLQLAADLTLDNNQLKVVLSWIGGNDQAKVTYDIYRFVDNMDAKELIASDVKDMVYVDTLTEPLPYKYIVVPRDEQGQEGSPSNVAEISTTQLENLLQDGEQHYEENPPGEGTPGEGENGATDGEDQSDEGGDAGAGDNENPDSPGVEPPAERRDERRNDDGQSPPEIQLPSTPLNGEQPSADGSNPGN